jgi:hypothetical protein
MGALRLDSSSALKISEAIAETTERRDPVARSPATRVRQRIRARYGAAPNGLLPLCNKLAGECVRLARFVDSRLHCIDYRALEVLDG